VEHESWAAVKKSCDDRHNLIYLGGNEETVACNQCESDNQSEFNGEILIHYPGLKGLDKPIVMVFPKLSVCLHCGFTEFTVPRSELRLLEPDAPAAIEAGRECDS
jgi:hypothetical protein